MTKREKLQDEKDRKADIRALIGGIGLALCWLLLSLVSYLCPTI